MMKTKIYFLSILFIFFVLFSCNSDHKEIDSKTVQLAQKIIDLEFSETEIDSMLESLNNYRESYQKMRTMKIGNEIAPRLYFDPRHQQFNIPVKQENIQWELPENVELPEKMEMLAFYPVSKLAALIKARKLTSLQITEIYLDRLKKYDDTLQC